MTHEMQFDAAGQVERELDTLANVADFCNEWKTKWRAVAVAAQAVLKLLFPAGAKVLGILITIADTFCASQG